MNNDCRALKPNHVSNPFKYDQLRLIGIQTIKKLAITDEKKLEHSYNPGLDKSVRQAEAEPIKCGEQRAALAPEQEHSFLSLVPVDRCYRIFIVDWVTTMLMPLWLEQEADNSITPDAHLESFPNRCA